MLHTPTSPASRRFGGCALLLAVAVLLLPLGCRDERPAAPPAPPNIIWICWDTVRADHLSVYGYERDTTPRLAAWARGARVYDDCVSPAPTTTTTHASWFTGRMPSEHGATDVLAERHLDTRFPTLAELLRRAGYQTYMFSANPNVAAAFGLARGFDTVEHPWDDQYLPDAVRIIQQKIAPQDRSSELPAAIRAGQYTQWGIKASGTLHQRGVLGWLGQVERQRPFFIFLNYMEAHRPYIPSETHRRRTMTEQQLTRSYELDLSWPRIWGYTFGLVDFSADELALTAALYDATLCELDDLLGELLVALEAGGYLANTVVVVTADHGEHLGEHHMLDHQYSVYEELLRVPLVIHYPARFPAGREPRPVSTLDLFPTLLELAGVRVTPELAGQGTSLLDPSDDRVRLAEYPAAFEQPFARIRRDHPQWDPTPWQRSLRVLFEGAYKYVWSSDGRHALYDLRMTPREQKNLIDDATLAQRLADDLLARWAEFRTPGGTGRPADVPAAELKRLGSMGYFDLPEDEPATRPGGPAVP